MHRHWKQQGRHQDTFEDPKGADLRRFDKFKKRLHMTAAPLWYNCKNCNAYMELHTDLIVTSTSLKTYVFEIWNMFGQHFNIKV